MNVLAFVAQAGHALVAWGLCEPAPDDAAAVESPGAVVFTSAQPLFTVSVSSTESLFTIAATSAAPLFSIEVTPPMGTINVGDTAVFTLTITNAITGALTDPTSLVIAVRPQVGTAFSLTYGVTPSTGNLDAVTRVSTGVYRVQVDITSARGAGPYECTFTATGTAKAAEDYNFKVAQARAS